MSFQIMLGMPGSVRWVRAVVILFAVLYGSCASAATPVWKPEKPVELIVPDSPGGGQDRTVRVLQKNGCEVHIPANQTCCGALHVHAGRRDEARMLARRNIEALLGGDYDAIITNAAGM